MHYTVLNTPRFFLLCSLTLAFFSLLAFSVLGEDFSVDSSIGSDSSSLEAEPSVAAPEPLEENSFSLDVEPLSDTSDGPIDVVAPHDSSESSLSSDSVSVESSRSSGSTEEKVISSSDSALVPYILYEGSSKVLETEIERNRSLSIRKEDTLLVSDSSIWKKRVVVSSEEHFDRALTVYSDIIESERSSVSVYWVSESGRVHVDDSTLDLSFHDTNSDGLSDRLSWTVPHLSEQVFEIIINITGSNSSSVLDVAVLSSPPPLVTTTGPLPFNFEVNYTNLSDVLCDFSLVNESSPILARSGFELGTSLGLSSFFNGNYTWVLSCYDSLAPEMNDSEQGAFTVLLNYSLRVLFDATPSVILNGSSVGFTINISSIQNRSLFYLLDYGDSSTPFNSGPLYVREVYRSLSHAYLLPGNYTSSLLVFSGEDSFIINRSITVYAPPSGNSTSDTTKPLIRLISPSEGETLDSEPVVFRYNVSDNGNITNCTFNLYVFNSSGQIGVLDYSTTDVIRAPSFNVSRSLVDFDPFDYTWEVECYDSANNSRTESSDFVFSTSSSTVVASSFSRNTSLDAESEALLERITTLLDSINSFLSSMESGDAEVRDVSRILSLESSLKSYKKRLLQMRTDVQQNLAYISDLDLRRERRTAFFKELDAMEGSVPVSLSVREAHEYSKNRVDADVNELIALYSDKQHLELTRRQLSDWAEETEGLNSKVHSSVTVRHIEARYADERVERFTLVTKEVEGSGSFDSYLEFVPSSVLALSSNFTLLDEHQAIDPTLSRIDSESSDEGVFSYSFESFIAFTEIEKTDTLAFSSVYEPSSSTSVLTGFSVWIAPLFGTLGSFFVWAILLVGSLVFLGYGGSHYRQSRIGQRDSVRNVTRVIRECRQAITGSDLMRAKELYERAAALYALLLPIEKRYLFEHLSALRTSIDVADASRLITEYSFCLREGRTDDALLVYEHLQAIYTRLPSSQKERLYQILKPFIA